MEGECSFDKVTSYDYDADMRPRTMPKPEKRNRNTTASPPSKPLLIDKEWLRTMPVNARQTPAERLVREDREGRD